MRPQGGPVVRSESSWDRRGRIVSRSSETARWICALGSWAPRLGPHERDMAGAIEMSARSEKTEKRERRFRVYKEAPGSRPAPRERETLPRVQGGTRLSLEIVEW